MSMSAIDALRTRVEGEVVAPGDGEYEEARKVYNGMIDKHPAAVVRCTRAGRRGRGDRRRPRRRVSISRCVVVRTARPVSGPTTAGW